MKMSKIARLAALLLLCLAVLSCAAKNDVALIDATWKGDTASVREILKSGANVNVRDENGWAVLMRAAFGGHTDIVKALLDAGANVNAKDLFGRTALSLATLEGHTETANVLRAAGAR